MTATKMSSVAPPIRIAINHSSRRSSSFIGVPFSRPLQGSESRKNKTPPGWQGRSGVIHCAVSSTSPRGGLALSRLRFEACFLVHLCDGVLADARFVLFVDRNQRLLHLGLFVGRERDDLRFAGLAHGLERVVVLLLRDVVRILGGVL